jgi:lipid II:glycine glycyltransferase (peptidoglycan interpeptide bridge formation enzyme)
MPTVSLEEWNEFINACPQAHILQSPAWGELKSQFGWESCWVIHGKIGAQVLFQKIPLGFQVAYIPRGPVSLEGDVFGHPDWMEFQEDLDHLCRQRKAFFLKIEPDCWHEGGAQPCPAPVGYRRSTHSIQPPRTVLISLDSSDDEILARMKSKTRYNIRLADKKGVSVRQLNDVGPFYGLLESTANRADFGIHTKEYYRKAFELFQKSGECQLFLADYEGVPLASIMVFVKGDRSWYFYGASSNQHRERMPTYLVQWEAIRWARERGCLSYDLWGVPDEDAETLENEFTNRNDGLWGVYRFKRGFGGEVKRVCGPWDRVYFPALYSLYTLRAKIKAGV